MKKIVLALVLVLSANSIIHAQADDRKISLTWLGVDYSAMNFILEDETITDEELQTKYFSGWNELFVKEPKRYDFAKATKYKEVKYAIDVVEIINSNAKKPFINKHKEMTHLSEEDIYRMVNKYNLKGLTGVGLVFIAESMGKSGGGANYWVTYIDLDSQKVIKTNREFGAHGGFGFRNYWASSVNKILQNMAKKKR